MGVSSQSTAAAQGAAADPPDVRAAHDRASTLRAAWGPSVTLGRLAFGAMLGMLVTAAAVYMLTPPPTRPPVTGPSLEASTPADDAAIDRAAEPQDLVELQQELERLRALLDGGALVDASADASLPVDAAPDASLRVVASAPPPIAPNMRGVCRNALPDAVFNNLLQQVPAMRQLPPEILRGVKSASPECACTPDPKGQVLCENWCESKGFFALFSKCVANKCQCANL
jgi:hypothetical protein